LTRAWRLLAHPDARHFPRVTTFFEFVIREVDSLSPTLTGWLAPARGESPL